MEWLYDGLKGKVIPWTKQSGGTSDDPSVQAFVVGPDGRVVERCADDESGQPKSFAAWLRRQADAWERSHFRTRIPFVPAKVVPRVNGMVLDPSCAVLEEAIAKKRPVALYVGREEREGDDAKAKAETAACRRFEAGPLGSEEAARASAGWVLLRLDRADLLHAHIARAYTSETAPAVVLLVPNLPKPTVLDRQASGSSLAYLLKKHQPAAGTK